MPLTYSMCRHLATSATIKATLVLHINVLDVHFAGSHTELHTDVIGSALTCALTALTIADSSPLLCQYFFTPYLLANRGQKFCNNGT